MYYKFILYTSFLYLPILPGANEKLGLRLGLRMDFLLCPILRPNILGHICSNRNTLTFDSTSYKKTNLSGVKIVVIVSPLPLVDAHTKICPKY